MVASPCFDAALIARHDRPGPRYTSYPTAPRFHEGFGAADLCERIAEGNGDPLPRPLSVYVHVPYCHSPCFYCGCNRVVTRDQSRSGPLVERLLREMERLAPRFDRDRPMVQLHFGGGTPNFLSAPQLGRIVAALAGHFPAAAGADRDYSIELDPRTMAPGDVHALAALGLNRASLGVQDFDPQVQQAVNRLQDRQQTLELIAECRAAGLRSVNVDLIYGLPRQTLEGFRRTLDAVLEAQPDRLAIYGYAHLPQKFRAQRQLDPAELPAPGVRLALLELAVGTLGEAGYQYIGMDHFALPDDPLAVAQRAGRLQRNFMGYTTHRGCDLIGFGPSAISHVGDSYSQNWRELKTWEVAVDNGRIPLWGGLRLSTDDRIRAEVIEQLMCQAEIDTDAIAARHDIDFQSYFDDALTRLEALRGDGLVDVSGAVIRATGRGRLLLRSIAMCFDRYLHAPAAAAAAAAADVPRPQYSQAI